MKNLLDNYTLEEKLFIYILVFSILLSVISIIGNIIIGFDFFMNYKWIILIGVCLLALKYTMNKKYVLPLQITISLLIIYVLLPSGWITTGGLNKLTISYFFLICVSMCLIFHGRLRVFFIMSEILIFLILIYIEQYYPLLMYANAQEKIYMDLWIQIPLTLFATAYMVSIFSNVYRYERKKLKEYSQRLKENNKKLIEISRTDELTGTYNRRYLFERLAELKKEMEVSSNTALIIMIDIDNFKYINDHYGHVIGDKVLKAVSSSIISIVNGKGFVGRYGGDEFIIVLENITIAEAKVLIERIKKELEEIYYKKRFRITVSGGMTQLSKDDDIDRVLANTDKLLYEVKNTSKNNVLYEKDLSYI